MPDPTPGTVDPELPPSAPSFDEAADTDVSEGGRLKIGRRWRDLVVEAACPDRPDAFYANHVGLMERVMVRQFPIGPANEWRRGAWERLNALTEAKVVHCIEAHEEDGWRYEVSAIPPSMTMREWMACHRPNFADIEDVMRQMATTLGALHAEGVVHLNLRPETIYIDESKGEPVYVLGGLEQATLYTQSELRPDDANPFYAPPEAAGGAVQVAGTRLCAWDWWSVGRVVQEFLIGHHVFSLVFDCDVSRMTPELRAKAELLQLEKEPTGVRPGALEFTLVDAGCMSLLRGLLTTACDARWGLDAVQRWLQREQVRDHYDLPRHARLWNWRGRGFTLAEAAEFFTQPENWDTGEDLLFNAHEPGTLAHFLHEVPSHRADWERLQAVCDLAESSAWDQLPVIARRTVTASLAWLALAAGAGVRPTLRVRGQAIDLPGLGDLLKESGNDLGVALLSALLLPPVIQFVDTLDAMSARVLRTMAAKAGLAVQRALEHGWLDANDGAHHARMFELALESGATLRERVDLLRAAYATNADPKLAEVFANKAPEPADLVVLAFTAEEPEKHGFISHENWRRQRCAALKAEGEGIVGILFWMRLRQLLTQAKLWGAPSTVFAGTVLALTVAVGVISRRVEPTAAVAGALLASRVWLWWRVRGMMRVFDPATAPWGWMDGWRRTAEEAERVAAGKPIRTGELAQRLREIRRELADLATPESPSPKLSEPQWWDLRGSIVLAVTVAVASLAHPLWREPVPEEPVRMAPAVATDTAVAEPVAKAIPEDRPPEDAELDAAALLATGRYEVVDDGFGRRLRGPLRRWDKFAPPVVPRREIEAHAGVTPEQSAFALVSGTLLLQPYPRKSVRVKLAVRVPTTRGFGVVLFNTRDRDLVDREVMLVAEPLEDGQWYQLGGHRALYLGSPLPMDAEISLARR